MSSLQLGCLPAPYAAAQLQTGHRHATAGTQAQGIGSSWACLAPSPIVLECQAPGSSRCPVLPTRSRGS